MKYVEWKEQFSVGRELMDWQHKTIIKLINKLIEAKNQDCEPEVISDAFSELTEYTNEHFGNEERLPL